ncbi:MFS general substrate transporter [Lophiostoma macrostomum CBS 122681]|uniref:MFS general substrate transporter n=1 Tax=Lophiostoma macrostomum CBS 122681 TaxID=1314788 RepID=A0A6A6TF56_9PLEO|nr:MFS general substrate transporter [Lophiostoma macrostomum CBS 122681]
MSNTNINSKNEVVFVEKMAGGPVGHDSKRDVEVQSRFSPAEEAKIRRRVSYRVVPILGLMLGIALMDRSNVANAAIAGMRDDLDMRVGYRYALMTSCFFITYVLCQAPMTWLTRFLGPRIVLPGVVFAWGILIIGFGFAKTWTTLVGLRLVLGILEAGFFGGGVYLLQTWFTRGELSKHFTVYYFIGAVISSFSGILAYGFMQMNGASGVKGWEWIFIMEGIVTIAIAIGGYFCLPKFPDQEVNKPSFRFLKPDECQYVIDLLTADRDDYQAEKFAWALYLAPARRPEIWAFGIMQFCTCTASYAYIFYLPIILRDSLKFSLAAAQCLVAPPYAAAGFLMMACAWYADKYKTRAPVLVFNCCIALVGLPMVGFASNPWVRYAGVFLAVAAINSNIPLLMAYQATNIRGQWQRAFCTATMTGLGAIGGISGSLVYRTQDAPNYVPGVVAVIVCVGVVAVMGTTLIFYLRHCNKQADEGKRIIHGSPEFRYTP